MPPAPRLADGSMPIEPVICAASSERMSPNRFSVTITSKRAGSRTSSIAHESTSWCASVTSGNSRAISSTTVTQSCEVSSTFALCTWVTCLRRPCARLERDARDARDLVLVVDHRVVRRAHAVHGLRAARLAEVEAAGQLAHDQQVDAVDDLGAQRRRLRRAPGTPSPGAGSRRGRAPCGCAAGRARGAIATRQRVPLRAADRAEQHRLALARALDHLVAQRRAVGVDRRAADQVLLEARSRARAAARPPRARAAPRASPPGRSRRPPTPRSAPAAT